MTLDSPRRGLRCSPDGAAGSSPALAIWSYRITVVRELLRLRVGVRFPVGSRRARGKCGGCEASLPACWFLFMAWCVLVRNLDFQSGRRGFDSRPGHAERHLRMVAIPLFRGRYWTTSGCANDGELGRAVTPLLRHSEFESHHPHVQTSTTRAISNGLEQSMCVMLLLPLRARLSLRRERSEVTGIRHTPARCSW